MISRLNFCNYTLDKCSLFLTALKRMEESGPINSDFWKSKYDELPLYFFESLTDLPDIFFDAMNSTGYFSPAAQKTSRISSNRCSTMPFAIWAMP